VLGNIFQMIGLSITTLVFLAVGVELAMRFFHFVKMRFWVTSVCRQDFLHPKYHTYINWTDSWKKPMFRYVPIGMRLFNNDNPIPPVKNNSLGFRTDEFVDLDQDEDGDVFKVVLIGGSAAWGFGATSNDTTIAAKLEDHLSKSMDQLAGFSRVKVINLAQVNQTLTQDILNLVFFVPRIKPHLVVGFNGWNELVAPIVMEQIIFDDFRFYPINELLDWAPVQSGNTYRKAIFDGMRIWSQRNSRLANFMFSKLTPRQKMFKRSVQEAVELASPIMVEHMERVQHLAKSYGFQYVQFLQPNIYSKKNLTDDEARAVELYDKHRPMLGGKANGDYLRTQNIYEQVTSMTLDQDRYGQVCDLYHLFSNDADHTFFSLVHCTDLGYEKIAMAMKQKVIADVLRP